MRNKMQKRITRTVVLLCVALLLSVSLSGCGFRMRGALEIPVQYKSVAFFGVAEFSPLGKVLRQYLSSAGLEYKKESPQADLVLTITKDDFRRRVLSVNSSGAANEYELIYTMATKASNAQGEALANEITIELTRNYIFDPNNVLAKSDEEARIKTQMQQLAVRQSLRQLNVRLKQNEAGNTETDTESVQVQKTTPATE